MALQTRPSPSWNVSPDICIIFGFLHNPPPGSPDIFTIHLQDLLISSQSTSIILECLPGHLHHLGCLRNPLHHLRISPRPSLPYISRPISGHRHQHCMAQNPAMRSCNSSRQWIPFHRYLWVWFRVQVPSFWRHLAAGVSPHISVLAY